MNAAGTRVTAELWGSRSPEPLVPPSRAAEAVEARARELGVSELVDWVPYDQRLDRLARADATVTVDPVGSDARYAFRTRLVDALPRRPRDRDRGRAGRPPTRPQRAARASRRRPILGPGSARTLNVVFYPNG